jgi:hypothetical protein
MRRILPASSSRKMKVIAGIATALILISALSATRAAARSAKIEPLARPMPTAPPFNIPQWTSFPHSHGRHAHQRRFHGRRPIQRDSNWIRENTKTRVSTERSRRSTIPGFRGHTTMILVFNRLVMPDGRRAPISAEIVKLYHAPSGEFVDVEGAVESGGRGKKTFTHTGIGAGAGALLGGIFGGGRGAGIGSIVGGLAGLGTTGFSGPQEIKLQRGLEMLIRITSTGQ